MDARRDQGEDDASPGPSAARTGSWRPAVWMLSSALGFSVMGALTHALGPRCDWTLAALVRTLFMLVVAVGLAWRAGVSVPVVRPGTLWIRSLAGAFGMCCNFYALSALPIGDVLTLSNTSPLWIVLLAWIWLGDRATWQEWAGVIFGIAGVVLIQRPHLVAGDWRVSIALLSSFSTAIAMIGLHKLSGVDARSVVAHFAGVSLVVMLAGVAVRWDAVQASRLDATTWLLLLGVSSTGTISQILLTKAYAAGPPGRMAVLGLAQVVFAIFLDVAIWGRSLPTTTVLGTALVILPTAWIIGEASTRRKDPRQPADEAPSAALPVETRSTEEIPL